MVLDRCEQFPRSWGKVSACCIRDVGMLRVIVNVLVQLQKPLVDHHYFICYYGV